MKFFQAACLLVASPALAFVPHKSGGWKRNNNNLSRQKSAPTLQLAPEDLTSGLKEAFGTLDSGLKGVVGGLDGVNALINEKYQGSLKALLSQVQTLLSGETELQAEFTKYATKLSLEIDQWLLAQNPGAEALYKQVLDQLSALSLDTPQALAISTVLTYVVVSSVLDWGKPPPSSKPYPLERYDPVAAQVYFDGKPVKAVARALEIGIKSLGFALSVLKDKIEYVLVSCD
jgi:hypothetical protein